MPSEATGARRRGLSRIIVAEPHEVPAVLGGHVLFFLLFASYFMLRPVRETFGIAGGVDNLQWLYLGTFLATLVVVPIYGTLAKRMRRGLWSLARGRSTRCARWRSRFHRS